MKQIHKRCNTNQVKELFIKYDKRELTRANIQETLDISKSRFFGLIKEYRQNPQDFDIEYERASGSRISEETENLIREELTKEDRLIRNYEIPIYKFNYAKISRELAKKGIIVSTATIIDRAKKWGFYRENIYPTNERSIQSQSVGELIHYDCNYALFSPASKKHWILTTITDNYSRFILDAKLTESEENINENIRVLESVFKTYGTPANCRISGHILPKNKEHIEAVLMKHKISEIDIPKYEGFCKDRAYNLLRERLTRGCIENGITNINEAQKILDELVKTNNYKSVNTISQEPPYLRIKKRLCQRTSP